MLYLFYPLDKNWIILLKITVRFFLLFAVNKYQQCVSSAVAVAQDEGKGDMPLLLKMQNTIVGR